MEHPSSALTSQFRRKNGQQSSCENCRKSKLACDHAIPHCGRCVRLKRTASCVYLLSPLTKSSDVVTTKRPKIATRASSKAAQTLEVERSPEGLQFSLSGSSSEANTSWGSIFNEFGVQIEDETTVQSSSSAGWKDPVLRQHAARALIQIPTRALCDGLIQHAIKYPDFGCHEPFLMSIHNSWWETFGTLLEDGAHPLQNLEPVLQKLWTNTASRKIDSLLSDSREWLNSWTGVNTTWDSLAYLLSEYGSAYASLPSSHPLLVGCDKAKVCRNLGKGIKACFLICEAQEISTVNLVNAHASMVLLQNSYDSDDCSLVRLVVDMGLHRRPTYACFLQTQLEHKAFHRAFAMDKSIATSGGRPPQLTRRLNRCPLPLDLSDEELLLSGTELDLVLGRLDAGGWSIGECSHPVSYLRALSKLGHHREETSGYSDILNRLQTTYKGLPQRLQYTPDHHKHLAPFDFLNVIFLHLEYQKNIFLLYRLSRAVPLSQNQPLLSSAKAIINVMTMLYTNKDRLGEMFLFFPWAVMFYGTPAAAIIAIELLVRPQYISTISTTEIQPRSETIQELSIFISCLKSIPTTEGNHAPCLKVARTLHRILDRILEPTGSTVSLITPPSTATATPSMSTFSNSMPNTAPDTPMIGNDWAATLDIDWDVFSTGPCDPDYAHWLDPSACMGVSAVPLDIGVGVFTLNMNDFVEQTPAL
ncbi:hypothetical protein N7454_007165 [Penicillium verhagenii]|nr:hypothetical protein N7454_007165 [Penicillium verhagenii]